MPSETVILNEVNPPRRISVMYGFFVVPPQNAISSSVGLLSWELVSHLFLVSPSGKHILNSKALSGAKSRQTEGVLIQSGMVKIMDGIRLG